LAQLPPSLCNHTAARPEKLSRGHSRRTSDADTFKRSIDVYDRLMAAKLELVAAVEEHRRLVLTVLIEHYPAAARRIMKGYARKPA
jgi:hypothetical protein